LWLALYAPVKCRPGLPERALRRSLRASEPLSFNARPRLHCFLATLQQAHGRDLIAHQWHSGCHNLLHCHSDP